jgi:hypothetical protein
VHDARFPDALETLATMEDLAMDKESPAAAPKEFTVPLDLLKSFQRDMRFIPHVLPINGWIIFDRAMLESILLSNDAEARKNLVKQLDKFYAAGGNLVMMTAPEAGRTI